MNRVTLILTFLLSLFLLSGCDSGSMSDETVDYGELIEREGLFYKKYTDVPYILTLEKSLVKNKVR